MDTKISLHGDLNACKTQAEMAIKNIRTFLAGTEMLLPDDITALDGTRKQISRLMNEYGKELEPFKELAKIRYPQND